MDVHTVKQLPSICSAHQERTPGCPACYPQECPKCHRPMNPGNSPNEEECSETNDEEGLCEAYAKIYNLHKILGQQRMTIKRLRKKRPAGVEPSK